jgi:hypothetical protein
MMSLDFACRLGTHFVADATRAGRELFERFVMTRAWLLAAAVLIAAGSSAAHARGAGGQGHAFGASRTASADADTKSNKGGAVRGLDRADAVAGAHGDKGRDRAEANKQKHR